MNYVKEKIFPLLIGAALSALGLILLSLFTEILPIILPSLQKLPVTIYLKLLLFLLVLLGISVLIIVIALGKNKPTRPNALSGKYRNIPWNADIDYRKQYNDIVIDVYWLCPKYRTPLELRQIPNPRKSIHTLFCDKCNKIHDIKHKQITIPVEEAVRIVRADIGKKISAL